MVDQTRHGPVSTLYEDYCALVNDLCNSPSGLAALNRSYHKHLLVAAASGLEQTVKQLVPELFAKQGSGLLAEFVARQVMARGYHTLFDWNGGSAKGFFGSFGDSCRKRFSSRLADDPDYRQQHDAFILLGRTRNLVVHNDYANVLIELTPAEIMEKYELACRFADSIESIVFDDTEAPGGAL